MIPKKELEYWSEEAKLYNPRDFELVAICKDSYIINTPENNQ